MKQFLKVCLWTGSPFGVVMGIVFFFISGPVSGLISGLLSGLFFGPAMAAFTEYQRAKLTGNCPLEEGETLIKEGPANHFKRAEGVGGGLYLTNHRLYFKSHAFNIQAHELSVPVDDILGAEMTATAWIIPNGLLVTTPAGHERFVVEGRRSWVEAIERAKGRNV